jgi:hypothetical protein
MYSFAYVLSLRPIHLVLHRHTNLDGYTILPGVPDPGRRQEGQQPEVPLLRKPRRLPRQALRLLRGPRAPGVHPLLCPQGGPFPR